MTSQTDDQAALLLAENGIDTDRLTEVLNAAGFDGRVIGIDPVLVGTGQVGENVRCRLTWDTDHTSGDRPSSVVTKLPSSSEQSRQAAAATRTYIREVGFYRDLARTVAIRVPTAYHVDEQQAENRFTLIMEDIAPARAGDQLTGCTVDEAELAIDAAAALHGSTWQRANLTELDWIDVPGPERADEHRQLFALCVTGFVDRFEADLEADDLEFAHWLTANLDLWRPATAAWQCLIHGDFRPDNMLFDTSIATGPSTMTTVDWQTTALGRPMTDVAYFLSGALDPVVRRRHEHDLLDRYRRRLTDHGVGISADELWHDYRMAAPSGFAMAIIASQLVGRTERGDAMFLVMARGSAALARDVELGPG